MFHIGGVELFTRSSSQRKAMHRGLTLTASGIDTIIDKSDRKLFRQATNPGHSLHHLLPPPKPRPTDITSYVRGNLLPTVQYSQFKNCFINRCLFKYV